MSNGCIAQKAQLYFKKHEWTAGICPPQYCVFYYFSWFKFYNITKVHCKAVNFSLVLYSTYPDNCIHTKEIWWAEVITVSGSSKVLAFRHNGPGAGADNTVGKVGFHQADGMCHCPQVKQGPGMVAMFKREIMRQFWGDEAGLRSSWEVRSSPVE